MAKLFKSRITSPAEIIGWLAIIIGITGAVSQLWKTHNSKNTESFSILYLVCAMIADLLFALQGGMKGSFTITATRIVTSLYFLYFLVIKLVH